MNTTDTARPVAPTKTELCQALRRWINQRPGLDPRNYDASGYRSDLRMITRQRADALQLLRAVELRESITAERILAALPSGSRLSWDAEKRRLDYVTGQYWCTEYRRAACAALSSILWAWVRETSMPKSSGKTKRPMTFGDIDGYRLPSGKLVSAGEWLRSHFRAEFGRGIASRWFN
jgi:hypothetical protein